MPSFDFRCKKCKVIYDEIVAFDPSGKYPKVICPQCGSKRKEKLMTGFSFSFSNPEGTDKWNSDSAGHDYRFHHKLPSVIAERQAAEEAAQGDTSPYNNIDDLNNSDAWGEVK